LDGPAIALRFVVMAEDAEGVDFGSKGSLLSSGAVIPIFGKVVGLNIPTNRWINWQGVVAVYVGISIVFGAEILKLFTRQRNGVMYAYLIPLVN
jgi:hypothetical protein